MTLFLPLGMETPLPSAPVFLQRPSDSRRKILQVIKSILKAKRVVVICGAGISVKAGIPDFRSSEGLFKTLKRDNPREALASGKDLFDASVFNSEHTTTLFCQMIAKLWAMSQAAKPTIFHSVLRALDQRGKLLRVYTQNIDAIEEKCGLSFGLPELDARCKARNKKTNPTTEYTEDIPIPTNSGTNKGFNEPSRCIPLHGTLQTLHCHTCHHSCLLEPYLPSLSAGLPPQCPECALMEETRQLVGKRARGIGKLRPSVVLYNEAHKDGEGVGGVVQRDLLGSSKGKGRNGADLLLVVGTSLRVPGTKRMVREFSKAVRSRASASPCATPGTRSPTSSPGGTPCDEETDFRSIYLNLDFPLPTRDWEGVFDAWIQGDAQEFAQMLQEAIDQEFQAKKLVVDKKRKRKDVSHLDGLPRTPPETPPEKRRAKSRLPSEHHSRLTAASQMTSISSPGKLCIRIPARSRPVSEVYVCVPSHPIHKRAVARQLPTPQKSPLLRYNLATKAGRRAARATRKARSTPRAKCTRVETPNAFLSDSSLTSDNDTDTTDRHLLPNPFLRTIPPSSRGAGG